MSQAIGLAVLGGMVSSALFLSLISGVPGVVGLAYFVQMPLMLAGLTMGPTASVIAAAGALITNGFVAGIMAAMLYGVVQAMPALVLVRQALLSRPGEAGPEWYPPGSILAQLAAMAAIGLGVAYLMMIGEPGGLPGAIEAFLGVMLTQLGVAPGEVQAANLEPWVFMFPGLVAASWLIMVVLNAILAQALAVRMGRNRRPSPALAGLQLPGWLWPPIGVAALLAWIGDGAVGFLGTSSLIVLLVPYAFLGLAVIHAVARRWARPVLGLSAVYLAIIVLGWPVLAVLVLGLVEDWAQLRRRFL